MLLVSNGQQQSRKDKLVIMDKETLAKRVAAVSDGLDEIVRSENTTIDRVETPFFRNGNIFRVVHLGDFHPMGFTVGISDDFTIMLPSNPQGFMELKNKAGLKLTDSPNERVEYVVTFLNTTRSFSQKFQILDSFEDVDLIPQASDAEKADFQALEAKYAKVIKPPHFSGDSNVIVFAVKQLSLVRIDNHIEENGDIKSTETVLEKALPIAFTY